MYDNLRQFAATRHKTKINTTHKLHKQYHIPTQPYYNIITSCMLGSLPPWPNAFTTPWNPNNVGVS